MGKLFPLFENNKRVMVLSYKPDINDVIRDDDTDRWYRVTKIEGRKIQARLTVDPRKYAFD